MENLLPIVEQGVSGCSFLISHLSNGLPDNRIVALEVSQQQKVKARLQNGSNYVLSELSPTLPSGHQ